MRIAEPIQLQVTSQAACKPLPVEGVDSQERVRGGTVLSVAQVCPGGVQLPVSGKSNTGNDNSCGQVTDTATQAHGMVYIQAHHQDTRDEAEGSLH